ncbi:hypothetical protein [Pseudomonas sp. BW7P1]|uniref:hypothetical protein n=1 Tax=Pseudomonas TaxID=286 RepID=UPI0021AD5B62|nr:hypothetical protein [Pseudomonas sp. BW7P1]UWI60125.1 hypothetical protein NWV16_18680 [Pseudomonas sp. BW7P1]
MSEFIYRFRPVNRLLGDGITAGELEDQYIFFASPEQLNDPLEGYRDVFFQGDKIVWKNLIKHYARCLTWSTLSYDNNGNDKLSENPIDVFCNARSATDEFNKLVEEICDQLFSEPVIADYVSSLSTSRKARRPELLSYIQILHFYFLDVVLEFLHKLELISFRPIILNGNRPGTLILIKKTTDSIIANKDSTEELGSHFQKSQRNLSEKLLLARYLKSEQVPKNWFFLIFEYPEVFCREIEKLMYPRWYTACFMSSCSDSSIWGSYGGNHQDVCLKFRKEWIEDRPALSLTSPCGEDHNGIIWSPVKRPFHEVSYDKSFVEMDFFRSLGHLPHPVLMETWFVGDGKTLSDCAKEMFENEEKWRESYWENFYHSVTVKLKAWDREKESRLILMSFLHDLDNSERRKLRYDFNSLEGVIFGINTPMESKLKIIRNLQKLCEKHKRKEFSLYQARYNEHSRDIVYDKLETINIGYSEPSID